MIERTNDMDEKLLLKSLQEHKKWTCANIWNIPVTMADDIETVIKIIRKMESPWIPVEHPPVGTKEDTPQELFVSDGDFAYKALFHFDSGVFEIQEEVMGNRILFWMEKPVLPNGQGRTLTEADKKLLCDLQGLADWTKETSEEIPPHLTEDIETAISLIRNGAENWFSVEQPPQSDGTPLTAEVFVSDGKDVYEATYHFYSGNFEPSGMLTWQYPITHWMPIPDFLGKG